MFAGSGGYYVLSGDEHASLNQPSYSYGQWQPLYPNTTLKLFSDPISSSFPACTKVLVEMARKRFVTDSTTKKLTAQLTHFQSHLLSAGIEQIQNEINADVEKTVSEFKEEIKSQYALEALTNSNNENHQLAKKIIRNLATVRGKQPSKKSKSKDVKTEVLCPILSKIWR